jgi:hypothetical protein
MQKQKIVVCGFFIFVGEVILILILLSAVTSFFPNDVKPFIPDSNNYAAIAVLYVIRLFFLLVAIRLLLREIKEARKDWANPGNFWFVKPQSEAAEVQDKISSGSSGF